MGSGSRQVTPISTSLMLPCLCQPSTTLMTGQRLAFWGSFSGTGLSLASTPSTWCGDSGRCTALRSSNIRQARCRRLNRDRLIEGEAIFPLQASGVGSNLRATRCTLPVSVLKAAACARHLARHVLFQINVSLKRRAKARSSPYLSIYSSAQPSGRAARGSVGGPTDFYIRKARIQIPAGEGHLVGDARAEPLLWRR